jgi:hypothetical protein
MEMPASFGVHGPGEMTIRRGRIDSIASRSIASLRSTRTFWPSSPRYWARL